jgi:hemolysin activation/secretion protein
MDLRSPWALQLAMLTAATCGALPLRAQEPPRPSVGDGFALPPLAGPAAAALFIDVKTIRFEGHTIFSTETLQALVADVPGRRLDPSGLDDVRERVSQLYVDAGYINSGALLASSWPAMTQDGVVVLRIVEGRIDDVQVRGLERLDPRYLRSRLVRDGEPLQIDQLQERFRLLLADPLFDKINSRIVPGDAPGSALLDIDVERARPYGLDVFVNNHRPPSVGATAVGLHGVVRNLTGFGDALDATLQHTEGGDPMRIGWSIAPLGQGTRVFAGYDRSLSAVVEESLAPIDIRSRSEGSEVGAGHRLVDTLARRVDLALAYARRRSVSTLLGLPFSFTPGEVDGVSEVRAWRFSQEWTERWEAQALALRSVFSVGRTNADPGSVPGLDPAVVPTRRYRVWAGQVQYVRSGVLGDGEVRVRGAAQVSPDRLVPLEQFSVGGHATVRGYRENAVLRDRGFAASAEFRHPLPWMATGAIAGGGNGRSLAAFTFLDAGGGSNRGAPWQRLASWGAGLSWQFGALSVDVSYARRLTTLDNPARGNLQDRGIQFQLSYRVL